MGLNPRGRGNKANFQAKCRPERNGMIDQEPMFRPGPLGMCGPSRVGRTETSFGGSRFFGESSSFTYGPLRPTFGNFFKKNFKKKTRQTILNSPAPEIDLTKPWVTDEIKNEENKKQELLQIWRKTKTNVDWSEYKAQKVAVQSFYDKAKAEYAANHIEEATYWENILSNKHFYCETCDKSFRTDDDLILHETEHETCGRDGCEFTAHPKIIAKHIKLQHVTGLYKKIGKLYTKEDIAQWIEERKKRYPTRKLVEEKKILEQEKLNRGERIKDKESKFNKKSKYLGKKKNFEKRNQRSTKYRRTKKKKKTSVALKSLEEEEMSDFRKGVPAFSGIKNCDEPEIPKTKDSDISDEEWEIQSKIPDMAKPLLNDSLRLLAAFYNSDEEIQNAKCNKDAKVDPSVDESSSPEEVKTVICKNLLSEENSSDKKISKRKFLGKNNQERKRKSSNDYGAEKRSLTLLEKLLKKEIRHERNIILQCIHYVVQNNFFKT